jgi:hypothetical protein
MDKSKTPRHKVRQRHDPKCVGGVLDLSIIQGPFSVAPCQTLISRFATFSSLPSVMEFQLCSDAARDSHRFAEQLDADIAHKAVKRFKKFSTWAAAVRRKPPPADPFAPEKKIAGEAGGMVRPPSVHGVERAHRRLRGYVGKGNSQLSATSGPSDTEPNKKNQD